MAITTKDGTIMIGDDLIILHIDNQRHVDAERSGTLVESAFAREFRFDGLEKGTFYAEQDGSLSYNGSRSRQQSWELV